MALQEEFRPTITAPIPPEPSMAILPPRRPRLAIVSTRNKLCGIAAYTKALERQLADTFEITVFDLDQYLLRSRHRRVRPIADRYIKDICRELGDFDAVNLQLEYGTLGRRAKDICRRFSWLAAAAPHLSVSMHSLARLPTFPLAKFASLRWLSAAEATVAYFHDRKLFLRIPKMLRAAHRRKPISIIVHNRRDRSDARHLHGFERVFDHPLSFLSSNEVDAVHAGATRRRFASLDALPSEAVLIGVFGFLNTYKGFETAVRALHHLPANHHLLIFGGTHPNEIRTDAGIHPYIASLLKTAKVDTTLYDQLNGTVSAGMTLDIERHLADLFGAHPRDLSDRLHFMGAPDDADFLAGMAMCDLVVFPYLEVGQSSSGPISQAVELGCRVIASRTHAFLEFATYHPETIEFFDIGNHLELAERIASRRQYATSRKTPRYNVESNKATYITANTPQTEGRDGFRRNAFARAIAAER
jgi:glycosyltransferase involved in cell wall biosynthesis